MHEFLVLSDDAFLIHKGSQPAFQIPAPCAADAASVLRGAGFTVSEIPFEAFTGALSTDQGSAGLKTLVMPYGELYPKGSWPSVDGFLKAGGNLLSLGGCPFMAELEKKGKVWPLGERSKRIPSEILRVRSYDPGGFRQLKAATGWEEIMGMGDAAMDPPGAGIAVTHVAGGSVRNRDVSYPLEFVDRFGSLKGRACAISRNHSSVFSGSTWVFFGSLPPEVAGWQSLLRAAARYLAGDWRIRRPRIQPLACKPGDEEVIEWELMAPRTGAADEVEVELELRDGNSGEVLRSITRSFSASSGALQECRETVLTDPSWKGFTHVKMILRGQDGRPLDLAETGWVVAEKPSRSECRPLSLSNGSFTVRGRPALLVGANYFITGTGLNAFREEPPVSPLAWKRDFELMRYCGVNSVRAFIGRTRLTADGTAVGELLPRRFLANLSLFHLMMRTGITPLICAHSAHTFQGMDPRADPGIRATQQAWTEQCVEQFKDLPVLWDLENEDGIHRLRQKIENERTVFEPSAFLQSEWNRWMRETLPANEHLEVLSRAGCDPGMDIPLPPIDRQSWDDPWEKAWRMFAAARFREWIQAMAGAVRKVDPKMPVTYSHWQDAVYEMYSRWTRETNGEPWFTHPGTDFNCVHIYWYEFNWLGNESLQDPVALVKYISAESIGKPGIIGETGMDPPGDEEGCVRFVERWCNSLLAGGGKGLFFWTWDEHLALTGEGTLARVDQTATAAGLRYRHFAFLARQLAITRPRAEAFLVVSTAAKIGGEPDRYIRCIIEAMQGMFDTGAEFQLISDIDLARLPARARVLIVPSPLCMSESAWARIRNFMEKGGSAYISGFFDRDEWLRPTEPRIRALLGREARELSGSERRVVRKKVGKGRLLFVTQPVEYLRGQQSTRARSPEKRAAIEHESSLELYREIVTHAGIPVARPSEPAEGVTIYPHRTARGTLFVARNRMGWPGVEIDGIRIRFRGEYGLVETGPRGVMLADAAGVEEKGKKVIDVASRASGSIFSQDEEPIRLSKALVVKLKEPGSVAVWTEASWDEPIACIVQFDGKGCREMRRSALAPVKGRFELRIADDLTEYAWLITEKSRARREIRILEKRWL